MISHILLFLLIVGIAIWGILEFNISFEKILPMTIMSLVSILFLFGLLTLLKYGLYVVFATCGVLLVRVLWLLRRNGIKWLCAKLQENVLPIILFVSLYALFTYTNYGMLAWETDEFSHWMDCVKVMTYLDDLGTNANSHLLFASYPPAMSLFQYFVQKVHLTLEPSSPFCEWKMYFAYQIFATSMFFPLLKFRKKEYSLANTIVVLVTTLLLPMVYFETVYLLIYIDPMLGIMTGVGLVYVLMEEDSVFTIGYLGLMCACLTLMKDAGLLFACFIAMTFIIWGIKRGTQKKILYFIPLLVAMFAKVAWKWEVARSAVTFSFGGSLDIGVFFRLLFGGTVGDYRDVVVEKFKESIVSRGITIPILSVTVNYAVLTVAFVLVLGLILLYSQKRKPEVVFPVAMTGGMVLLMITIYVLGIGVAYISTFIPQEAVEMDAFKRYADMGYLAMAILVVFLCLMVCDGKSIKQQVVLALGVVILICAALPIKTLVAYLNRDYVTVALHRRWPYQELGEKIYNITETDETVCLVVQGEAGYGGYCRLILNFAARPYGRITNEVTCFDMDRKSNWQKELVQMYDYVALYKVDTFFVETYAELFGGQDFIMENSLYRVNKENGFLEWVE